MGRKRRVDTHERARVSSYFEVDSYLVSKIFRAPATQACVYIAMWQIHREFILGKEREQAEAFVMRCKAVAVDREPDRCGNSVWKP